MMSQAELSHQERTGSLAGPGRVCVCGGCPFGFLGNMEQSGARTSPVLTQPAAALLCLALVARPLPCAMGGWEDPSDLLSTDYVLSNLLYNLI